jgi:hypothetical protein
MGKQYIFQSNNDEQTASFLSIVRILALATCIVLIVAGLVLSADHIALIGLLASLPSFLVSYASLLKRTSTTIVHTAKDREAMLDKVWFVTVGGDLENPTLHKDQYATLAFVEQPNAVELSSPIVVKYRNQPSHALHSAEQIEEVFNTSAGGLLILGGPGSGKTTLLLRLNRNLITEAKQNPDEPIPVILNLSSWSIDKKPIQEWIVKELKLKYQVPASLANGWIDRRDLILLLDGLDELRNKEVRKACVIALNQFRAEKYGLGKMVVCSRTDDYGQLQTKLQLHRAIVLEKLTLISIKDYFARLGSLFTPLYEVIKKNTPLQRVIDSPLTLSVFISLDDGTSDIAKLSKEIAKNPDLLWRAYILKMLRHRGNEAHFSHRHSIRWLVWLAERMSEFGSELYLENIQPRWIRIEWRRLHSMLVGLVMNSILLNAIIVTMLLNLGGLFKDITGVAVWTFLIMGPLTGYILVVNEIKFIDRLHWSWERSQTYVLNNIMAGIGFMLIFGATFATFGNLTATVPGVLGGLVIWLSLGVEGFQIPIRTRPGEGITNSGKNALISFGAVFLVGILGGILTNQLLLGSIWGLLIGNFLAMDHGGRAFIQYWCLRLLLKSENLLPLKLIEFLDYATALLLVRKVGAGYRFFHRELQDYLAKYTVEDIDKLLVLINDPAA